MSIEDGAFSRGAETDLSNMPLLKNTGDPAGEIDPSVKIVEGDSVPGRGDDFQPKNEENLLEGEFLRLLGETVWDEP